MQKSIQTIMRFAFAFIVIVVGSYVIVAQDTITGTWKASIESDKPDSIYFQFSREDGNRKHKGNFGSKFEYSDFEGLSKSQVSSSNSKATFRLVREAGTIECEGTFNNGEGRGTFRFTPDAGFASQMENRGFKFTGEKLFAATSLNLTVGFVDDLRNSGFDNLDVDDLFKAVIFKVTPQFMSEMASIGFPNLDMEDLVKARIFKIDANYAREIANMGFRNDSLETLVQFRIFKVTPEFLREVQAEGLANLKAKDVVQMRIFKIDGAFIRNARVNGYTGSDVDDLVQMKIGVWKKD